MTKVKSETNADNVKTNVIHFVKTVQPFFDAVIELRKTAEIRKNDRNYQTDDVLVQYSADETLQGCFVIAKITHVLTAAEFPDGLKDDYVMLSLTQIIFLTSGLALTNYLLDRYPEHKVINGEDLSKTIAVL